MFMWGGGAAWPSVLQLAAPARKSALSELEWLDCAGAPPGRGRLHLSGGVPGGPVCRLFCPSLASRSCAARRCAAAAALDLR